uniref:Methyltransferase FkbM domain-containing protein n=1 Tax=Neobodo designis TaxID=312471 RepID=A0A7S1QDW7_NEODS|mmetsp:Transcript_4075/g.12951  ORF Transcript_4075/g.12951 Transcript_4075/m.12951 type:complete len:100 (+) Transcript_4075:3-302(+)
MDIEGAEWVVLQAILQRGVADRIAALFLECHHYRSAQNVPEAHVTRDKWFTLPEYLKKGPKPTRVLRIQQWYAIVGLGMECYVAHDLMRRAGVATYEWP